MRTAGAGAAVDRCADDGVISSGKIVVTYRLTIEGMGSGTWIPRERGPGV